MIYLVGGHRNKTKINIHIKACICILQNELDALNAQITNQGAIVRTLKKEGAEAEAKQEELRQELLSGSATVEDEGPMLKRKRAEQI